MYRTVSRKIMRKLLSGGDYWQKKEMQHAKPHLGRFIIKAKVSRKTYKKRLNGIDYRLHRVTRTLKSFLVPCLLKDKVYLKVPQLLHERLYYNEQAICW